MRAFPHCTAAPDGSTLDRNLIHRRCSPKTVRLTEIGGDISVSRSFGPFHLYDIPQASDGIVGLDSSYGYLGAKKRAARPSGVPATQSTNSYTITSDSIETAAAAVWTTKSLLARLVTASVKSPLTTTRSTASSLVSSPRAAHLSRRSEDCREAATST
jgi:hypothetical protein